MKKLIGVMAICLMAMTTSKTFAQSGFGVRGGFNTMHFGENPYFSNNSLYGYHAGVYAKIAVTRSFNLQPELLFSRQGRGEVGGENMDHLNGVLSENKNRLDFIDAPVFLRFNITNGLHFLAGPQFSFLLGSRNVSTFYPEGNQLTTEGRTRDRFDLGGVVGLGYEFFDGFNLGVRYGYMYNNFNTPGDMVRTGPRNILGQFTLGYTFGGRGKC